jgi:hypothetical protein
MNADPSPLSSARHHDQIGPFTWPQQKNITPYGNEFRNNLIWTKVPHTHHFLLWRGCVN